jgi:predicted TPR repeat methyltransferase
VRAEGDAEAPRESFSEEHFTGLYLAKDDPWDNATKWSDQRKYAVMLASLRQPRYRRAYEPGCAVGIFTRMLAARCDEILAVDAVDEAVAQARAAVAGDPHVRVEKALLPQQLPDGTFDLIVVGDLLYYLSAEDLMALLDGLAARLEPGGDLVAAHFRDREAGGYDGFNVHTALTGHPGLERRVHHEDEWFVVDVVNGR